MNQIPTVIFLMLAWRNLPEGFPGLRLPLPLRSADGATDLLLILAGYTFSKILVDLTDRAQADFDRNDTLSSLVRPLVVFNARVFFWAIPLCLLAVFDYAFALTFWTRDGAPFSFASLLSETASLILASYHLSTIENGASHFFWNWPISLVQQMALLASLFLMFVRDPKIRFRTLWIIVAIICLAVRPTIASFQFYADFFQRTLFLRADVFCIGALLYLSEHAGVWDEIRPPGFSFAQRSLGAIGLILVFALFAVPSILDQGVYSTKYPATAAGALLLVCLARRRGGLWLRGPRFKKFWRWCETRTYAMFVFHVPVLRSMRITLSELPAGIPLPGTSPLAFAMAVVATVTVAALVADVTYRYVQRPVCEITDRFLRRFDRFDSTTPASSDAQRSAA